MTNLNLVLALSDNQKLWWLALIVGLVVAVVVWVLLETLRRFVNAIDSSVMGVWTMGKRVAQNTQMSHVLFTTAARGDDLVEELGNHRAPAGSAESPERVEGAERSGR